MILFNQTLLFAHLVLGKEIHVIDTQHSNDPGRVLRKKLNIALVAVTGLVIVGALAGCFWTKIQNQFDALEHQPTQAPATVQQVSIVPSTVTVAPTSRKREVEQAKIVTTPESESSAPATATSLPATATVVPATEVTASPSSSKAPMVPTTETSAPTEPSTSSLAETPSQG